MYVNECLHKIQTLELAMHTVEGQPAALVWDGFPAWGVFLAVVRSGPSRGKRNVPACTFGVQESPCEGQKGERVRQPTHSHVYTHASALMTLLLKKKA